MTTFAKYVRWIRTAALGALVAGTLTACGGGGGDAGTPVNGGGNGGGVTPTAAKLVVELDRTTVNNSGSTVVDVKVTSTDANGAAVPNVPVGFGIDANGIITPAGTKTDGSGVLHATAAMGADRTNRTITITAVSGTIKQTAAFNVVDSVTGGKVADLSMTLSAQSIPNDGSVNSVLTITSLDANRSAIGGSPVTLAIVDPAGTAFVSPGGTTDTNSGQLTAQISVGANKSNRVLTVTATSGTVTRTVTVNVVTPTSSTPQLADMTLVLDKISIGNTGSDKVTATVTAVDAQRNVVPGIAFKFEVDSGATLTVLNGTTNASGQATATINSGADKSNRLITVSAGSGTLSRTATFQVLGAKLVSSAVPQQPASGSTGNKIDYRLSDVNQNPMTFQTVTVTAPGFTTVTGQTDANGAYSYVYTAPTTPGPIDITASAGGVSMITTVTVPSASSTVPPAGAAVVSSSLSSSPTVVSVNTDSTNNRTELRAIFLAANNAPVKNVRVRFDLNGDVNSIGGTIGSGTQLVYTDAAGVATTNYSPGNRPSPTSGVTIRACWDNNDFIAGACPNQILTTLTVVSDPLSISIGTNSVLDVSNPLTYRRQFVVLVVDAAGQPKGDVQITPSLDLTSYNKGFWVRANNLWSPFYYETTVGNTQVGTGPSCLNEDSNRNGLIDGTEDRNGNGQLDPRKSDASVVMTGSTRTDANGQAVLVLEYPRSLASWVNYTLTASAFGVLSPPASFSGTLSYLGEDLTNTTSPAFQFSPYGRRRVTADGAYCLNAD